MIIYLSGPMDGCSDSETFDWREMVKKALPEFDFLDPTVRDYRGRQDVFYRHLVNKDKTDIDGSDILLANCWKPSVGTSMEIIYAFEKRKAVISVCSLEHVSPWLLCHSDWVFKDLDAAIDQIRQIDVGEY